MNQKDLELIFDPFYRTNSVSHIYGNGLGLAIVKKSISAMNGDIYVSSQLDIGSTFTIVLKYKQKNFDKKSIFSTR